MAPTTSRLAIDLSGASIRVVEGMLGGPMHSGSAAIPEGGAAGGKVIDPHVIGATLRGLLARSEIAQTRALVAAADTVATFRILRLPESSQPNEVDAAIARDLPFDPHRMATRWTTVRSDGGERVIYAVVWDRALLNNITDAVKLAGVEPVAVELKSASLARVMNEPASILLDLTASPAEILLVDEHLPQVWHSFVVEDVASSSAAQALAAAIRTVLRFYRRRPNGGRRQTLPVFVSSEQTIAPQLLTELALQVDQPVGPLPAPPRVPATLRHSTYLACIGLLMRRSG